ncbi:hypothetical protein DSO57_1009096 [Entomophthora muscae]|uniref:Uncharacterized protein n=1 Tax=Entomophthora muscae TaxID=34485 RepID=A0ACC2S8R5_9FUNG|nr:hypothetical protein DSO57_1009096 [Entomophthora muscae]
MSNRTIILLAAAGIAFATNPDEESFRQFLKDKQKKAGIDWLTSSLSSRILSLVVTRKDYKLFSLVKVPESKTFFIGIFGTWIEIPCDIDI